MKDNLAEIARINKDILAFAKKSDWDSVATSTKTRHQHIENIFKSQDLNLIEQLSNLNKEIRSVDDKVKEIIKAQKKQAISDSINLKNSANAIKAYRSHPQHYESK